MSGLDYINTVRIQDAATANEVNAERYQLDQRAEHIAKRYNIEPMTQYEFAKEQPPREKTPRLEKIAKGLGIGLAIGAAIGLGAVALGAMAGSIPGVFAVQAVAAFTALGGMFGFVDDEKPDIDKEQLQKYKAYLDKVEDKAISTSRSHSPVEGRHSEEKGGQHFQHMVDASRSADLAAQRG